MIVTVMMSSGQKVSKNIVGNHVTIGRSAKADLTVPDESLSRSHCTIELVNGNFFITDLGSSNGVYIDGEKISANTRIPFNSFSQLSLASLECSVADSDKGILQKNIYTPPETHLAADESDSKTSIRSTNRNAPNKTPKKKIETKNKSSPPLVGYVAGGLILVGAAVFYLSNPSEEVITEVAVRPEAKPEPAYRRNLAMIKNLPDEFKLTSEYAELNTKKDCVKAQDLCENMSLDTDHHEGIVLNEQEAVVFINPYNRKTNFKYTPLNEAKDQTDLIALEIILRSEVLNQYLFKKINHIHIVINLPDGRPEKVYRIHPIKFVPGDAPRMDMLGALNNAFQVGKTDDFWTLVNPFFSSKSLQE